MSIPLEDSVGDIIGKAQRGLGVDDAELAKRLEVSSYELSVAKEVKNAPPQQVTKLAAALELDAPRAARPRRGQVHARRSRARSRLLHGHDHSTAT